jgi:hypothetical protein
VSPDLTTDVSASTAAPAIGSPVAYTVAVRSKPSTDVATAVRAQITLPAQVEVDRTSAGCGSPAGRALVCELGTLGSPATAVATIWTTVRQAGTLTLSATATLAQLDGNPVDNSDSLTLLVAAPLSLPARIAKPVGRVAIGARLRAPAVARPPGARIAYRWQLCRSGRCRSLRGETRSTLVVRSAYAGARLRVLVTLTTPSARRTAVSAQTAPVPRTRR